MIRDIIYLPFGYFLFIEFHASRVLAESSFGESCNSSVLSLCKMRYGCCPKLSEHKNNYSGSWLKFKNSKEKLLCGKLKRYPQPMKTNFAISLSKLWRASIARSSRLSKTRIETSRCFQSGFKRHSARTSFILRLDRRLVRSYLQQVGNKSR